MPKQRKNTNSASTERLRLFLDLSGLSMRQFAERAGIPYRTLQDYIADKRRPGADHLERLSKMGADINWLLTGDLRGVASLILPTQGDDRKGMGVIGADRGLVQAIFDRALSSADTYAERRFERTMRPLSAADCLTATAHYYVSMLKVAAQMVRAISVVSKGATALGESESAKHDMILEILSPATSPDRDVSVDEAVQLARQQRGVKSGV